MAYGVYSNEYQGSYKKVLCVCSAGILRSPTIAHILSAEPYNFNTRIAGCASYALTPVTEDLLQWADEIVCADTEHAIYIRNRLMELGVNVDPKIINLKIEDIYEYRNPELVRLIHHHYTKATHFGEDNGQ